MALRVRFIHHLKFPLMYGFVRIGQCLAEIKLFEYLESEKKI